MVRRDVMVFLAGFPEEKAIACCASPTGVSRPVPVSIGAPGSRPQVVEGDLQIQAGYQKPVKWREPFSGERTRGPQLKVKPAAVAALDATHSPTCARADPTVVVPCGYPQGDREFEPDTAGLGSVFSHWQCGDSLHSTGWLCLPAVAIPARETQGSRTQTRRGRPLDARVLWKPGVISPARAHPLSGVPLLGVASCYRLIDHW